jgi:hypothetical protein
LDRRREDDDADVPGIGRRPSEEARVGVQGAGVEPRGVTDHWVEGDPCLGDAPRLEEVCAVASGDVDGR